MRIVSAGIAALLAVTTIAPAAFAGTTATSLQAADARVTSLTPAHVLGTVTNDSGLAATLEALEGVPLGDGEDFRARVSATNLTDVALEEVVLRLDLTASPLTTRAELASFLEDPSTRPMAQAAQEPPVPDADDGDAEQVDNVASARGADADAVSTGPGFTTDVTDNDDGEAPEPLGERIDGHADRTFTLEATAADLGVPASGWGVYGATLTLVTQDSELVVDSFPLTWGAQDVPQLDLAVVAAAHGLPSRVQGVLETSNLPGVAVAVDPAYVTPAHVIDADLQDREVFRLPTHNPDLTSIAHAGNDTLIPLSLSLPRPSQVPTVTNAPWLAMPAAVDGQSVALAGSLEAAGVLALPSATGFDQLAANTDQPVSHAEDTPVLVPDATLSTTVAQYRPGTPAAAALAVADSALLAGEQAGTPALVALGTDWHIGRGAQSTLSALLDAPWTSSVTVSSLLEGPVQDVGITETLGADTDMPAEHIENLAKRLVSLALLATVTEFPDVALSEWGTELLRGISVEDRGNSGARDLAVRNALDTADTTLGALRIADSSDLNLLTESGDIPITVVNALDHAVTVTVDLRSYSSNLQVLDSPTVTVPAATDQVVLIPVEAVSTANVFVNTVLRNTDGDAVSDSQPFSIRVRADWGNAATAVFTVVLVLLLVAGLIRTIRRGRKDTRVEPSAPPETMDDDNG